MSEKSISMCQGKGSLSHNNRDFTARNIDKSRTADNVVFVCQDLGETYRKLFDGATERYNAHQKRNDRKISDYFEHLFSRKPSKSVITGANKQKSFYEDLVQIGTRDDTGVDSADAETAKECLREYMEGFQERNPNLHVFNAVMHLDEATPHLHIDYIPVGHFSRGLDTRNAMAKALEEMGHGTGANAINRWRLSEWDVLHDICTAHGIEISAPKKSRGYSYTVQEYGEHQDRINTLNAEIEKLTAECDETAAEFEKLSKKKVSIGEIENIEARESVFGKKVTLSKADYDRLSDTAKKYVAMEKNIRKLRKECDTAVQELETMKQQFDALSSEYSDYRKDRESIRTKIKCLNREEQLTNDLKKARDFITARGLSDDFERFKLGKTRIKELE